MSDSQTLQCEYKGKARIILKRLYNTIVLSQVRRIYSFKFRTTYRYKVEITNARSIAEKLPLFFQSIWQRFINRRRILCYPERPLPGSVLYKILFFLGYDITIDPNNKYDIAIHWRDAFDGDPYLTDEPSLMKLANKSNGPKVLNIRCKDITKKRVSNIFEEVFGYPLSVDPSAYNGQCVMKSNWNALHLGRIIECPTKVSEDNCVYEKVINNEVADGIVEDIRVPIFRDDIPFVYLKYRSKENRFIDRDNANFRAIIAEVIDVFSEDEVNEILSFFNRFGLDYGEIDVLRDRDDGRIYIVDVNHTPWGPPDNISEDDSKAAIFRLARTFEETFIV